MPNPLTLDLRPGLPPDGAEEWCQPSDIKFRTWMVWFEDSEQGISVFDNEAEARAFWEQANITWNCYLFQAAPLAHARAPTSEEITAALADAKGDR